ncbi:30S ribosomal protein S27e [archaeon]|nr:30S ribosomal protein S27e [archaeon]
MSGELEKLWKKLFGNRPRNYYVRVRCLKCGGEQYVYIFAATRVPCHVCGETLAEPTGGKAKILGEIVKGR